MPSASWKQFVVLQENIGSSRISLDLYLAVYKVYVQKADNSSGFSERTNLQGHREFHCLVLEQTLHSSLPSALPTVPPAGLPVLYHPQIFLQWKRLGLHMRYTFCGIGHKVLMTETSSKPCLLLIFWICSSKYSLRFINASDHLSRTQFKSSS